MPTYLSLSRALFAGKRPCFGDLSSILRRTKFDIRARLKIPDRRLYGLAPVAPDLPPPA
jgi:hypothetical protein